jgi:hypothetical protein
MHHSDLAHTLEAFLEELTGRVLGTLEGRVDFFLALRAT